MNVDFNLIFKPPRETRIGTTTFVDPRDETLRTHTTRFKMMLSKCSTALDKQNSKYADSNTVLNYCTIMLLLLKRI